MEKYEQLNLINRTLTSRLYTARYRNNYSKNFPSSSSSLFVIKRFLDAASDSRIKEVALQEATLLKQLHHPNVIRILDCFGDDPDICIVMPYIAGGTLYDRLCFKDKLEPNTNIAPKSSPTTNNNKTKKRYKKFAFEYIESYYYFWYL